MAIRSDEVISYIEKMIAKEKFNLEKPNPRLAWEIFKEFSIIEVVCNDDALLFECGIFNFTGENLFYLEFVRQFSFNDDDGEYDHMEQFHFTTLYKPYKELEGLKMNKWSFDFNSFEEFFQYIESLDAFNVPLEKYAPLCSTIAQEEV
jgi:hypothetical protein